MNADLFTRKELQALRDRAMSLRSLVLSPSWQRAYNDLAHAADVLDAFVARATVVNADSEEVTP